MNRSGRNRTMTLTEKERAELQSRLVLPEGRKLSAGDITDRTILADLRTVLPDLPSAFVDLLILDPPTISRKITMERVFTPLPTRITPPMWKAGSVRSCVC